MPLPPSPSGTAADAVATPIRTPTSQRAGKALHFWEACRLRADDGAPHPVPACHLSLDRQHLEVLLEVLTMGYGLRGGVVLNKGKEFVRARTTPSAGALYPFDVLVQVDDRLDNTHVYDVEEACFRRYPLATGNLARSLSGDLPARGEEKRIGQVLLITRPWLSMRKYGQRGYLYTKLDISHVAASVALAARSLGLRSTVHLRIQHERLAQDLGLGGLCREPEVAVTVDEPDESQYIVPGGSTSRASDAPSGTNGPRTLVKGTAALDPPSAKEEANWRQLLEGVGFDGCSPPLPARFGDITSVLEPPNYPEARVRRAVPCRQASTWSHNHRSVVFRRESAKGFLPLPLTLTQVTGTLFEASGVLHADCAGPGEAGVSMRMMVRKVEALEAGVYAYSGRQQLLLQVSRGRALRGEEEVLLSCMRQPVVRHASVILTLHASLRPQFGRLGRAALNELHFHAAHVAHKLTLSASRQGVGITCIGGFDEKRSRELVGLGPDERVIYVLALGITDPGATKLDRDAVAHGHGLGGAGQ
jgi:hypothetical protein